MNVTVFRSENGQFMQWAGTLSETWDLAGRTPDLRSYRDGYEAALMPLSVEFSVDSAILNVRESAPGGRCLRSHWVGQESRPLTRVESMKDLPRDNTLNPRCRRPSDARRMARKRPLRR